MSRFAKVFWLWFGIGAALATEILAAVRFNENMLLGRFLSGLFFWVSAISIVTAMGTNFGRGYWTHKGWFHSNRAPWPTSPVKRPRIGGFTTGYATVAIIAFIAFAFVTFTATF